MEQDAEPDFFARAFEEAGGLIFAFDAQTRLVTEANAATRAALGYSLQAMRQMTLRELVVEPDARTLEHRLRPLLREGAGHADLFVKLRRSMMCPLGVKLAIRFLPGSSPQFLAQAAVPHRAQHDDCGTGLVLDQLEAALETLPDGFVLYDRDDRLVLCNGKYKEIYGLSAASMVPGARFEDILRYGLERGQYVAAKGREEAWLAERMSDHRRADRAVEQQLSDGRWLRILERPTPEGGRVGLRIDVTSQILSRRRAEQAEIRLKDAIDALPAGFWLFDADDRLVMLNERYRQMFASSADSLREGATYEEILRYGLKNGQYPDVKGDEEVWIQNVLLERAKGEYEIEYRLDNGRWIRSSNSPTSEGGLVGYRIDITELKEKQQELERAADTDALTGLVNRRGVSSYLARVASRLDGQKQRLAAFHVDLDKFKAVNDAMGHEAGDFVLCEVADRLRRNLRDCDLIARIGGDEFLVLTITEAKDAALHALADALRTALGAPMRFHGRMCQVGATLGISTWAPGRGQVENMLVNADIALNIGKRDGRNRSRLFSEDMRQAFLERAVLAQEVREALADDRIVPYFQPQFSADGKDVLGFECLARWVHPERGVMAAGTFLEAAAEAGLMVEIDRAILTGGLSMLRRLTDATGDRHSISVNISSAQLGDVSIVQQLEWLVDGFDLPPDRVRIEILESSLLNDRSAQVTENIHALSERGFLIELDDFGTGHAAITSLREYPVSRIKVDRSLVSGIDRDERTRVIAETIVSLGNRIGLEVLDEGVETAEEMTVFRELGCSAVQGFHLARPMSEDALYEWLRARGVLTKLPERAVGARD